MSDKILKTVNWMPNDDITLSKMVDMVNNTKTVANTMITGRYARTATPVEKGLKIISGRITVPAKSDIVHQERVDTSAYFSVGCLPLVVTGVNSNKERRVDVTVQGISDIHPTHEGFNLHIYVTNGTAANKKKIEATFYVDWIAIGY